MRTVFLLFLGLVFALASDAASVRVAAISFVPEKFQLERNCRKLEAMFRQAAAQGAQLALAPEGILEGYVVNEIIAGEVPEEKMKEVAVSRDGPVIRSFRDLALELRMCLAFGFAELRRDDVFNAAIFIDHEGKLAGVYHKMQFHEGYHPSWWFNRLGASSRAFDTPFGRCGFLICNDRWNPDLARIPCADAAQFLLIPAYGSRSEAQDEAVQARARENGVPLVEANVGLRMVVDANGHALVQSHDWEGVSISEIDIPKPRPAQTQLRDRLEKEFLNWRAEEMKQRYQDTLARLRKVSDE